MVPCVLNHDISTILDQNLCWSMNRKQCLCNNVCACGLFLCPVLFTFKRKYHIDAYSFDHVFMMVSLAYQVNWHKGKSSLFSLTSLHAKDIGGEPLYLNYRSGSGFVEISRRDRGCALWKVVPYKAENYGDDDDVEFSSYCMSSRKAFYLVNHKNNSGVSFVDGFPEFVKNPGSPFKMKVFHELNRVYDAVERNFPSSHIDGPDESFDDERRYLEGVSLLHMSIKIERISITLFHEISDADDKFPLVHGCIGDVHIIGQILPSKVRLICTYFISMDCFDAKMNSWLVLKHLSTS